MQGKRHEKFLFSTFVVWGSERTGWKQVVHQQSCTFSALAWETGGCPGAAEDLWLPDTCLPTCIASLVSLVHGALEQHLDIVAQHSWGLDKLTVKDHHTDPALWRRRGKENSSKQRVGAWRSLSQLLTFIEYLRQASFHTCHLQLYQVELLGQLYEAELLGGGK